MKKISLHKIPLFAALTLALCSGSVHAADPALDSGQKVTIVLVGDSTVADQNGWGPGFKQFLNGGTECINTAMNGRSSLSYMREGRWTNALALKGNYYLIQFGHNNQPGHPGRETDMATYIANMKQYVDDTLAIGAKPILVTPLTRREWDNDHPDKIKSSLAPYAVEVRKIAAERHVPLVDLQARSIELCESLGPKKCLEFSPAKIHDDKTNYDRTHLNALGSVMFARLVVDELRGKVPALDSVLRAEPSPDDAVLNTVSFDQAAMVLPKVASPVFLDNKVQLTDFGGGSDGIAMNTSAFEKAIAYLANKGGGELVVPSGVWLTGPIHLRSNINLHLERGARVQFSRDYKLYPLTVIDMKGEKSVDSTSPISGENLENIAITGEGVIDGGGDAWRPIKKYKLNDSDWKLLVKSGGVLDEKGTAWWPSRSAMDGEKNVARLQKNGSLNLADYEPYHQFLRPKMVRLIGCKRVLIEGVTFQNPPMWTLNPVLCEDVSILNVQVHNSPAAQNSDALDLESCRRAIVRDCIFDAGDDGICLKSGKDSVGRRIGVPTEDVLIEGCTVYHGHGGFVIGSEMSGGVRNVCVNNCTFMGTDIGLRFKSARDRGGVVEKIDISNVRMTNITGAAINFNMYYGGKPPLEETGNVETNFPPVNEGTPQFRDIHISNVICRSAQKAIVLEGLPEMPIRDIFLKDVSITSKKGVFVTDAAGIQFDHVRADNQSGTQLIQVRVKNSKLDLMQ